MRMMPGVIVLIKVAYDRFVCLEVKHPDVWQCAVVVNDVFPKFQKILKMAEVLYPRIFGG